MIPHLQTQQLINGGHRPRQSVIKSTTVNGSTMTMTRSEKRCFIRYVNTVMAQAQQKCQEEKERMERDGSWALLIQSLQQQQEASTSTNQESGMLSPRGGRRTKNVAVSLLDMAVMEYWKPMEVVGSNELDANVDLFARLQDGLVFCHLLDKIQSGLVEWSKVNKRSVLTPLEEISRFQKIENQGLVIELASSVGCQLVGIGANELSEGLQQATLALLWQLIRQDVTKRLNVMHSLRLIALKEENETVVEFMKLPAQQLLLRFVNYNLKKDQKCKKVVSNFTEDWKDSEAFCYLIKNIVDSNNRLESRRVECEEDDENEDDENSEKKNKINPNLKQFTDDDIQQIMTIENQEERAKKIIDKINELGLNPNMVQLEGEDISTGVGTLIMTMVSSMFNATNLNSLTSELTEDPEKMTLLRREILDNFLEMLKDDLPEIKRPEMKVFLEVVKSLSDVDIKDIEEKIVQKRINKMKAENRKLKKQGYIQYSQSENYKKRIEDLEKIIADQKKTIEEKDKKNNEQQERIAYLEHEIKLLNDSRKDDLKMLGGEDFLNGKEDITAEEIRKKTSQKIEELVKRVAILKENLVQTKKDLNYGMTLAGDNAETKLAEFRFGSLTAERLTGEHKPTMVGWMEKRGRVAKSWKKRYFILLNNYVFYFTKEKGGQLKGFLRIEECEIERVEEEVKGMFVFQVKTMGRILVCRTDSSESREDWVKCLYDNSRMLHE